MPLKLHTNWSKTEKKKKSCSHATILTTIISGNSIEFCLTLVRTWVPLMFHLRVTPCCRSAMYSTQTTTSKGPNTNRVHCVVWTIQQSSDAEDLEPHLVAHVEWESHHAEVVDDEDSFEVKGFAVLHYSRPQRCDKVNVRDDDDRLRERRGH